MPTNTVSLADTTLTAAVADCLDSLTSVRGAEAGLRQVDEARHRIAPGSVFSIQRNVTTEQDPADEILLRRFWSSQSERYPVNGTKRKTLTAWTRRLFLEGVPFVAEGNSELARHFDDHEQMHALRLQSVVNVPLLQGNTCYATFNVFGTQPRWSPQQVLAIRLLALAASRWVPCAPALCYRLGNVYFTPFAEA
jgi:hypothetical protein